MKLIQVLGPGCPKCENLRKNAERAVALAGIEARVEKVSDIKAIISFGVMITPALAVDGQVRLVGQVASPEEIAKLLA
jgi:small redox-active disulfide protein 2